MAKLTVKETNNKAAKFLYQVVDEAGKVLAERRSNRVYEAATTDGNYFFGRKDLVLKGEHGKCISKGWRSLSDVAYFADAEDEDGGMMEIPDPSDAVKFMNWDIPPHPSDEEISELGSSHPSLFRK